MSLRERGVAATVHLKSGEQLRGWMYAHNSMGVFISLDRDGRSIRYLPSGQYDAISYQHDLEPASFRTDHTLQEAVDQLSGELREPLSQALDRIDLNRIKRVQRTLLTVQYQLAQFEDARIGAALPFEAGALTLALDTRAAYSSLLDELEASGMASLIRQYEEGLLRVASPLTMPLIDAEIVGRPQLLELLNEVKSSPTTLESEGFGRKDLDRLQPEVLVAQSTPSQQPEVARAQSRARRSGGRGWRLLKGLSSWAQVALGGTLAAGNVTIGAAVVITTGLPTLGLSTAPAAVAVGVSVYTGLTGAAKSLRELAADHGA